jgi:NAD(P)-dependent dehydrogenase (short-subunit alcohol dehydrogenase family)
MDRSHARLKDKVAVVTGGARGMGLSHARLLAMHGAAVAMCDVRVDEGEAAARDLVAKGCQVRFWPLDVSDEGAWEHALTEIEVAFGAISILVNNAGILGAVGGIETEEPALWERTLAVLQTGPYLGMRAVAPRMRRAGGGSIVNVSSILGFTGDAELFGYNAAKGALRTMTRSAALKLAADRIRVNTVCPGLIRTPMNDDAGGRTERNDEGGSGSSYLDRTPLKRMGEPVEVSHAVLFLASDESSFVTGTDLVVDGGYLAQ